MRILITVLLAVSFSGCGLAMRTLEFISPTFEELQNEARRDSGDADTVREFQALLEDGWRLFLYDGDKIVLVKDSPNGLLIKDVFGVLNDDV